MNKPKLKCVTLSVDIGVLVPVETVEDEIVLNIPHDKVKVLGIDGKLIRGGKVIEHMTTATGVVDSFTEEEADNWQKEPLPEES